MGIELATLCRARTLTNWANRRPTTGFILGFVWALKLIIISVVRQRKFKFGYRRQMSEKWHWVFVNCKRNTLQSGRALSFQFPSPPQAPPCSSIREGWAVFMYPCQQLIIEIISESKLIRHDMWNYLRRLSLLIKSDLKPIHEGPNTGANFSNTQFSL